MRDSNAVTDRPLIFNLGDLFSPVTDHVISSRDLFFYNLKTASFIYTRLFDNLKARTTKIMNKRSEIEQQTPKLKKSLIHQQTDQFYHKKVCTRSHLSRVNHRHCSNDFNEVPINTQVKHNMYEDNHSRAPSLP